MNPQPIARSDSPEPWKTCLSSTIGRRCNRRVDRYAARNALVEQNYQWACDIARKVAAKLPTWFLAEDLIGPASLALLDAAGKFDPRRGIPFRAYARLAVEGACYSAARRNEYRERAHDELTEEAAADVMQSAVRETAGSLPPQVWKLPPDQFRIIQLCYLFDLTVERAAARMHISPSKASQHHRAALDSLRGLLGGYD